MSDTGGQASAGLGDPTEAPTDETPRDAIESWPVGTELRTPKAYYVIVGRLGSPGRTQIHVAYEVRPKHAPTPVLIIQLLTTPGPWAPRRAAFFDRLRIGLATQVPGLARVLDGGERHGVPFVVRELIDGVSLEDIGERMLPSVHVVLTVVRRTLEILAALHAARLVGTHESVIHGRLRASQIFVLRDGALRLSEPGSRYTPEPHGWRPPPAELARGRLDARTDLYALGLVALGLLGAAPAEDEAGHDAVARALASREAPGLTEPLLRSLVELEPAARPASAESALLIVDDALRALGGPCDLEVELEGVFEAAHDARRG